jgi:hypothetical protein
MRAMCLIEAAEDGAIFSLGSNSTARSYPEWCAPRIAPFALGVLVERLAQEGGSRAGDVARTDRSIEPGAGLDGHLQPGSGTSRTAGGELLKTRVARDAEADQQPQLALRLEIGTAGAAVELVLEDQQRV